MNLPLQTGRRSLPSAAQTSHLLQSLFPPQAVILVGVSRSQPHLFDWPSVRADNILLVDAAPEALANTRQSLPKTTAWQMRSAVLADHAGEAGFFTASNPGEDGLVPPQQLAELWPNLRTTAERTCTTQTLHALLAEPELAGLTKADDTWLVIDCLPALRILQGAGALLQRCKVISLRVLLEPLEQEEPGSTLAEAERYLAEHHFRCIHCTEENHPQIGQALFLRDDSVQHGKEIACFIQAQADLADERDNLEQQNTALLATCQALKAKNTALQTEREALRQDNTALAAKRQAQLDALTKEKAELLTASDALAQEKAAITAARDEQTKLANERLTRIEMLTRDKTGLAAAREKLTGERDQQAKLAAERQSQLDTLARETAELLAARDALAKEKASLTAARDEQIRLANKRQALIDTLTQEKTSLAVAREKLTGERDQQAKLTTERDERIRQLEAELQERLMRLHLMQDELVKGEAQIELIKDLLLPEPNRSADHVA